MILSFPLVVHFVFADCYFSHMNVVSSVDVAINYLIRIVIDWLENSTHALDQRPSPKVGVT